MQPSLKPASYETQPNRPRREPFFLSSHMLYLTGQRTKLSDFWCFGILRVNKDGAKSLKWLAKYAN
jgi:hypothetical protein